MPMVLAVLILLCSLPAVAHMRHGAVSVDVDVVNDTGTPLRYAVPYIEESIEIDGADDEWHAAAMVLDETNLAYGDWAGPDDVSGDLRLVWNDEYLFFFARVRDDELVMSPRASHAWRGDGVQFAFDGLLNASQEMNGGRKYDELALGVVEGEEGAYVVSFPWHGAPETLDVELAVKRSAGTRHYEWAIPWSDLQPISPDFLAKTGFGFSLRDADANQERTALAWTTGTIEGQPRPRYGVLEFEAPPEPQPSFLALPPEWNVVDRGNRFVHLPDIDANGTAILLAQSPMPRLVTGEIRVLAGADTVAREWQIGRIRHRPLALVWDLNEVMADLPDGSYTLEYQVTVPELAAVRFPLHYSRRIAHMGTATPPEAGSVSADGLIAHWDFDDCTVSDVTGNGHDGVAYGSPECVDGVGEQSRALRFEPTAPSYALVDRDIKLEGDYTLSSWVRLEDSDYLSWQFIIARMQRESALRDGAWSLRLSRSRIFFLREFFCCVEDERWTMITATGSGDRGSLYVDGELVLGGALTRVENEDDLPICIGCTQGNSLPPFQLFRGAIDELRVYGRALSDGEVAALYRADVD